MDLWAPSPPAACRSPASESHISGPLPKATVPFPERQLIFLFDEPARGWGWGVGVGWGGGGRGVYLLLQDFRLDFSLSLSLPIFFLNSSLCLLSFKLKYREQM